MKDVVLEITHPKRHINYIAIENRLKQLKFVSHVDCNANLHSVAVKGLSETTQSAILKNALFQMGYTAKIIND